MHQIKIADWAIEQTLLQRGRLHVHDNLDPRKAADRREVDRHAVTAREVDNGTAVRSSCRGERDTGQNLARLSAPRAPRRLRARER